jgi:hypothetical protein
LEQSEKAEPPGTQSEYPAQRPFLQSARAARERNTKIKENTMMKKHSMKKMLRSIVCMVLIAAMALACMGCAKKEEPKTEQKENE